MDNLYGLTSNSWCQIALTVITYRGSLIGVKLLSIYGHGPMTVTRILDQVIIVISHRDWNRIANIYKYYNFGGRER